MADKQRTTILKYKKSDAQFRYEDENIIQPLIAKIPKARSGRTHAIKLPKYISFTIEELSQTLHLYIQEQEGICDGKEVVLNATCNNMQSDNAAFEGWAICLTWIIHSPLLSGGLRRFQTSISMILQLTRAEALC